MTETYSIPEPPEGVTRIRTTDDTGMSFTLNTTGVFSGLWSGSDGGKYRWSEVLDKFGEVEEIPLTDSESAVAFFRDMGIPNYSDMDEEDWSHARVLIEDALSRG